MSKSTRVRVLRGEGATDTQWQTHVVSWATLCETEPISIAMDFDDYHALPKDKKQKRKASLPWIILGTAKPGSTRSAAAMRTYTGLVLDIEQQEQGQLPPPLTEAAARCKELGIAAWLYTTTSHKDKEPRYRIAARLDAPISATQYVAACRALAQALDLQDVVDPGSYEVGRIMYLPAKLRGGRYETQRARGQGYVPPAAPPSEKPKAASGGEVTFANLPTLWNEVEARKVRKKLKTMNPDMRRDPWLRIGQALHSADPNRDGPAFEAWDSWSRRSEKGKYKGERELRTMWRGFTQGGGITLATLYAMDADESVPVQRSVETEDSPLPYSTLDQHEAEATEWLVPEVLAAGELTLLAATGGVGKSVFGARIAHMLIHGGAWPAVGRDAALEYVPGELVPTGDVAMLCAEESINKSLRPRFDAQGTDTSRVILLGQTKDDKDPYWVRLDNDLDKLTRLIHSYPRKVAALIVDPITGYLGDTNQNSESALREMLQKLVAMARKTGIAILGLVHLNKKVDLDVVDRIMGGKAFGNVSRHVLAMAHSPDDRVSRYCGVSKTNIGTPGLAFIAHGRRWPHPKDDTQVVWTHDVDPTVEYEVDIDGLMQQTRRKRIDDADSAETMRAWVMAAIHKAGTDGIELDTLYTVVAGDYRRRYTDKPAVPTNFEQMVKNKIGVLARAGKILHRTPPAVMQSSGGKKYRAKYYEATPENEERVRWFAEMVW